MTDFKASWDLDMTLQVLRQETIDSVTWADAAKWLLPYGPPAIREILQLADGIAFLQCFPDMESRIYTENSEPCFDIRRLAIALGLNEEEVIKKMRQMEKRYGGQHPFSEDEIQEVQ